MGTLAQIEASRRNGARSSGPTTAEGKSISTRNALKHGMASHKTIVLEGECQAEWDTLLQTCVEEYGPETQLEYELVVEIAVARWRMRRSRAVETAMFDIEAAHQRTSVDTIYENPDAALRHAAALRSLGTALHTMERYQSRAERSFERAVRNFDLQQTRRRKKQNLPNEPKTLSNATPSQGSERNDGSGDEA